MELLKCIALTLMVIGFGLAVLLPGVMNIFSMVDRWTISTKGFIYNAFWMILAIIASLGYVMYFIFSLYYIWIHNGFI